MYLTKIFFNNFFFFLHIILSFAGLRSQVKTPVYQHSMLENSIHNICW